MHMNPLLCMLVAILFVITVFSLAGKGSNRMIGMPGGEEFIRAALIIAMFIIGTYQALMSMTFRF